MNVLNDAQVEVRRWMVDQEAPAAATVAYLAMRGPACPTCAMRIRSGLLNVQGVFLAEVDQAGQLATALYDSARLAPPDLVQAAAAAGHDGCRGCTGEFMAQVPAELALFGWQ